MERNKTKDIICLLGFAILLLIGILAAFTHLFSGLDNRIQAAIAVIYIFLIGYFLTNIFKMSNEQ